jgi:hypothetical protein
MLLMSVLVVADGISRGNANSPLGLLGVLTLAADANLTYGAGLALVAAATASTRVLRLDDVLHARGVLPSDRLLLACFSGCFAAITLRLVALVAGALAGIVQSVWRAGHLIVAPPGAGSVSSIISGQGRVAVFYLLAGLLGALIALALRSLVASVITSIALVALYFPAMGAVAQRAPKLIDVLPWLPFGALRALLSSNAAIFGARPTDIRFISIGRAAGTSVVWFLALGSVAVTRTLGMSPSKGFRFRRPTVVVAATLLAVVIGWALPTVAAGHVPWQWSAQWRDAEAHGRSTIQIAKRWPHSLEAASLYATPAVAGGIDRAGLINVPPFDVKVPSANELNGPLTVPLVLRYRAPLRTGNVAVASTEYQLRFEVHDGRYLITRVEGPLIAKAEVVAP